MNLGRNITYESLLSRSVSDRTSFNASYGVFERKSLMEKLYFIVEG